ncbi:MAG: leucine--tRNA ligase [Ferruginibacter sp.]
MEYDFRKIEERWREQWKEKKVYKVNNPTAEQPAKPKFYVLDMFPYPSGAGLHVGHPLGYIASDIYSRFKRLKGFNVLHPMGFDSFGLPAEQYAIETGQHPATTTEKNIGTFKAQLDKIGFCYDWEREVRTSDASYYKWTQCLFLQLFNSYFCNTQKKARPISDLIRKYETQGTKHFTAAQWNGYTKKEQQEILMKRRLAFSSYGEVNWCEALGTVLANDEVVNGVSERGGHPVIKKKMRQWYLRITAYADRLLEGLEKVAFSESMKEMQRNWIGKSEGAELEFRLTPNPSPAGEGSKTPIQTANKDSWPILKDLSRENRKSNTLAEDILWQRLGGNQLDSKARRRHVIENFIIDFAFLNERLLIEVDGDYHNDEEQQSYDDSRSAYLNQIGYKVIRFRNREVEEDTDTVIAKIKEELKTRASLSLGRGVGGEAINVYTTRPDTIFGVDFLVLAPEHELVSKITTDDQRAKVEDYLTYVKSRSDRERMAEVKQITGCFTGAYAMNPFDGKQIPIWIAEYVLAGYGTGAIMAVPCGDQRDFAFANHFKIPITNIIGDFYNGEEANPTKDATLQNSGFLNGMLMKDAIGVAISKIEELGIGKRKVNYRMRDAGFSRQRYWGEPFPVIWEDGIAVPLNENELPLELPFVEKYGPGPEGEGPLANIEEWVNVSWEDFLRSTWVDLTEENAHLESVKRETSTMPGYAGSSWYFLRYMDPKNNETFCDRSASDYWNQVDVYIGGTEHAVGHLLYSRMWTKVMYDLNLIGFDEPFKRLVNQGMIQGSSRFVYRVAGTNKFVSYSLKNNYEVNDLHVDVNIVDGIELNVDSFRQWKSEYANAEFILEDGKYICGVETEKMSKRYFNTVDPVMLTDKYGADTFRMYEMFLGPVEQSKPWDTKGIEGVHRFLRKLWRLFFDELKGKIWNNDKATDAELKVLHKTIKKIESDTENFSFNTAVSAFMISVNELADLKCHKKEILEQLLTLLVPYAPHIAEELWHELGNEGTILDASYPVLEEKYLVETSKEYPISINGKLRTTISMDVNALQPEVEKIVLENDIVQKWLEGNRPKKIIFVKGKMVNVVL